MSVALHRWKTERVHSGETTSATRNRLTPSSHSIIAELATADAHISYSLESGRYQIVKPQDQRAIDARTIRLLVRAGWIRSSYRFPQRYELTQAGRKLLRQPIRFSAYQSAQDRAARKRFPHAHFFRPVQMPLFSYLEAA